MVQLTVETLRHIMPGARRTRVYAFVQPLNDAMMSWSISLPERATMFLAQIAHESQELNSLQESLYYSTPERLMAVWPSRFRTLSEAQPYARNPEKLANKVYANRMGNGDEASGDGWKYHGRGLIMLTGRRNYERCALGIAQPIDLYPDLLTDPVHAADSAGWFWNMNGINALADEGDFLAVTMKINGGTTGLQDREKYWERAREVIQ